MTDNDYETSLRVLDVMNELLDISRTKCEILESGLKVNQYPRITPALHRAIEMAISAWKEGCDVYTEKYGGEKWGNTLQEAFMEATVFPELVGK